MEFSTPIQQQASVLPVVMSYACRAVVCSLREDAFCQLEARTRSILVEDADEDMLYERIAWHRAMYSCTKDERDPEDPESRIRRGQESSISFGPILGIMQATPLDAVRIEQTQAWQNHCRRLLDAEERERQFEADDAENVRVWQAEVELAAYHRVKARLESGEERANGRG